MARKKTDDILEEQVIEECSAENKYGCEGTEETTVCITLKNGGSYHFRSFVFVKNDPVSVPLLIAERLMKTGFFERK